MLNYSPIYLCAINYISCWVTLVMSLLDHTHNYIGQVTCGAEECLAAAVNQAVQIQSRAVVIAKGAMLKLIGFLTDMLTIGHLRVSHSVCMCLFECVASGYM